MSESCNVCGSRAIETVFRSGERYSITTMNTFVDGETVVAYCPNCDHAQTAELPDLARFYAEDYEINIDSADEDQLYGLVDGANVYRSEHQANTLATKINLTEYRNVLDYGCAKAHTLRRLVDLAPNIRAHMFDVTDKYISFWASFPGDRDWAAFEPKAEWAGAMDVVLSFYALEHIKDLDLALENVKRLLRDGGIFYFIVPNLYENVADLIVADHVNHFSRSSLHVMLKRAGFRDVEIDETAHAAAFVVHARLDKAGAKSPEPAKPEPAKVEMKENLLQIVGFWERLKGRIQAFEASLAPDAGRVIYGAGIYGNYIFSCLREPQKIAAFLDQNKFLAGKEIKGVPIRDPADVPAGTDAVLVGLNPKSGRDIIANVSSLQGQGYSFLFLDDVENH